MTTALTRPDDAVHRTRRTFAITLASLLAGCGGSGSGGPTAAGDRPGNAHAYDVRAALLALFNGQFAEARATAKIEGLLFDLKVTPLGGGPPPPPAPGSTVPAATYWTASLTLQLTASGHWASQVIGYRYERMPTRVIGATMSTPRMTAAQADAAVPAPTIPTAATIGEQQEMMRGSIYELDYTAGYDKPPVKQPFPGSIARSWRLDPDDADSAFLCLIDEVDDGTSKGIDDYCFSIRPDGRPTGRFRATLTDTDTGQRHDFEQAASAPGSTPAPTAPPAPAPLPPDPGPLPSGSAGA